jgi:hypothetical protein
MLRNKKTIPMMPKLQAAVTSDGGGGEFTASHPGALAHLVPAILLRVALVIFTPQQSLEVA